MDRQRIAKRRRDDDDRLSKLGDGVLGHILSFLDTKEAARAAALSSRWRDIFASVHTVSLEEPEKPIPDYDSDGGYYDPTRRRTSPASPPFPNAASVPLRTLRVAMESYNGGDASTVDHWVSRALKDAAPELQVHLRLRRVPVCRRPDPSHDAASSDEDHAAGSDEDVPLCSRPDAGSSDEDHAAGSDEDVPLAHEDDDAASSSDESVPRPWELPPAVYTVPSQLFSCSALRSLRLGSCRLCPPATVSLPSLEVLRLTHVGDEEEHLQRLISACPHLADLTLEACGTNTMTALSLLDNTRLRRLALRCCHKLAAVTVHASELRCFEYRGTIPDNSFLTVPGRDAGGGFPSVTSCKIEVCTVCVAQNTAMSQEQLAKLGSFLELFVSTKQLHLCAAHMSSCFVNLPAFPSLTHLQLDGCVRHDSNDPVAVATTTITILQRVPNLEVLTMFFEAGPHEAELEEYPLHKEGELLDYDTLDLATVPVPRCLGSKVRRISLVHYQGGRAQRMLARFLLRNAPLLEKLFCELAEGPLWIQTELVREMETWVMNERASKVFV
ncbi:hypothetical protein VPH35_062721 [Triticum aestivum]